MIQVRTDPLPVSSVLAYAAGVVERYSTASRQRALLDRALEAIRVTAAMPGEVPFFAVLPLHTWAAACGDLDGALPLAAATTLLYAGIDLLDDVSDGDLDPSWNEFHPAEIQLGATTLLSCLPALALAGLAVPARRQVELHQVIAARMMRMAAGQQADIAMRDSFHPSVAEVERSVEGKSGEELALFAVLGALAAGAPTRTLVAYDSYGRSLGQAAQISSDCHDIFQEEHSRDLTNGTRTLPLVIHLDRLSGSEKVIFLTLLDRARDDREAALEVRRQLRESGVLRRCAFQVEVLCQRALGALRLGAPREPASTDLENLVRAVSFSRGSGSTP